MGRGFIVIAAAFAALMFVTGLPTTAKAELKFCNQTKSDVNLAIGYKSDDSSEWVSEGWWIINPGKCETPSPFDGVLKKRYYYYYADSDDLKWDGDYIFCTSEKKFTIVGDKDCKSRGYAPEGFREIDVGEATSKEIDLTSE